ncbi:MAG: hypothetical protein M1830_002180 [Pleopsidium flavum]|nr:MAG: hypothetical protein M1830_002180 [Pleopsidium flavum]
MAYVYNSQLDAFSIYHKLQETPQPTTSVLGGPALPALGHAIAGSTGAAISNICTYPLDLIITRLQIQRQLRKNSSSAHEGEYRDISDAAGKIYTQEGGLSGFYTGVVEDTGKTMADSFLFFLAYNFLRQNRLHSHGSHSRNLPTVEELSVGILAGAFAKLLTTPVANIVTRKQTSALVSSRSKPGVASSPRKTSVRDIAAQIRSEKGLQGFWSGYSASLVLTLNPSLTFFFYETFKRSLLPRTERDNPSTLATFLLAAMSKAIASSITYPFSLAKARAQASSRTVDDNDQEVKEGLEKVTAGEFSGSQRTRKAARTTVFSTILHIARTEGVGALYEGLGGEVIKGFFSHGITMIVKEAVHKFIIQLYYMILKMLKRYPSPQELAHQAKERTQTMVGDVSEQASQAARTVSNGTQNMMEKGQEMAQNGSARAHSLYQGGKEQASNFVGATQSKANATAEHISNTGSSAYNTTKDTATGAYDKTKDTASKAYGTTKDTASTVYDKTGSTADNVYDATKDTASTGYDKTKSTANSAYDGTKDTAAAASDKTQGMASSAYDATKDTASTVYDRTKSTASSAYDGTKDTAAVASDKTQGMASSVYDATKDTASTAYDKSASMANGAYDTTKNTTTAASDKTQRMASSAYDATKNTANTISSTTANTGINALDATKDTSLNIYTTAKDTANTISFTTASTATNTVDKSKSAANQALSSADSTKDSIAEYVGRKTENLGSAIRPDSRKVGEEGS